MSVEFGQRVSAYMERADLSQRALARKIHIRRSTISRVVRGDSDLSAEDEERFEKGLSVPLDQKLEFTLSSQGRLTNLQIEQKLGKPMRGLEEIRQAKRKYTNTKGQSVVMRY